MSFALRYAGRDFPLNEGRFTIGRSEECQLCLDDPVASRQHAAVLLKNGVISVEDLGSRNGVFLNETRIDGQLAIKHGDRIRIGLQEIVVIHRAEKGRADTLIQGETTPAMSAFGVLGGLAEKAMNMGRGDEAERIIGRHLDALVEKAEVSDDLSPQDFDRASSYALKIAELTRKSRWVICLFRLHAAMGKLMDAETVNVLYSLGPKLDASARSSLRDYISSLEPMIDSYAPGERFVIKRLEGLEHVIR